jgi:hypothetical protein
MVADLNQDPNAISKDPYYGTLRMAYGVNLLGDPALSVWTETPKQWTNTDFFFNGQVFTMDTKVPYTWVALCGEAGNIITTQFTGEDGLCTINDNIVAKYFADHPGEDLKVRIKAHNFLPFLSEAVHIGMPRPVIKKDMMTVAYSGRNLAVSYTLLGEKRIYAGLYNARGTCIETFTDETQRAGTYSISYLCDNLSSGIYYVLFKKGDMVNTCEVVLVR